MNKKSRLLVTIIIAIVMICTNLIAVYAATQSDLNSIQNKINEAKNNLNNVNNQKKTAQQQVDDLNSEIAKYESEIDKLEGNLYNLQLSINENEEKLAKVQSDYAKQYDSFNDRIVALYEAGETTYLDILLSAADMSEFISSYYVIEEMAEMDNQLLDDLENSRSEIEKTKKQLEDDKAGIENAKKSITEKESVVKQKKNEKQQYVNELTEEQKEIQKEIDEYNAERKKIEAEIAAASRNNSGGNYKGGKLTWPCPNYVRISGYFGYRSASSTGGVGSTNHKGVDMAAANGASIVAAESGTVTLVSNTCTHNYAGKCRCGGGFGNYIQISHGGGLSTLYAHCSSILVTKGQVVSAGQKIATVGSTGNSTGYHLHFSVIKNGTYVDPFGGYISR